MTDWIVWHDDADAYGPTTEKHAKAVADYMNMFPQVWGQNRAVKLRPMSQLPDHVPGEVA